MTREEFLDKVGADVWASLKGGGFDIEPCTCGETGCEGWRFFHPQLRALHTGAREQRVDLGPVVRIRYGDHG